MNRILLISVLFLFMICPSICHPSDLYPDTVAEAGKKSHVSGFIRGGFYAGTEETGNKVYFPGAFSDIGVVFESGESAVFKAFADVRFRFGSEFGKQVSRLDFHEGYVRVSGKKWDLAAGQKIIKWGRADFTNPTSRLNPVNLICRSPDREDMDMGNLLLVADAYPLRFLRLQAVAVPMYRPSVLITDPVPLPEYVIINSPSSFYGGGEFFGYGLKADFHITGFDWSVSWFDGFDPMPGIELGSFDLNLSDPIPVPITELNIRPYRNRVLGLDFETAASPFGLRGEAAWALPALAWKTNEYVPLPEIKYAAGIDWSTGAWRFTCEYSGKYIPGFEPSAADPLIGTDIDPNEMAALLSLPGFDMENYVRQQVGAFNRLYNYQLKKTYHSAGMKAEAELIYGKLVPSVLTIYNMVSRDLLVVPEIKIKPSDGLTITTGMEIYSGPEGSLYDIINGFMNSVYLSLRADF